MIKKAMWAIPTAIGSCAILGVAIGLGYTGSQTANPYVDFFKRPVYNTPSGLADAYMSAVTNGAKMVIGAGFTHEESIKKAVSQSFFQKNQTGFILLDKALDESVDNCYQAASITFRISEAAFLTGIALGEYLNYYQDIFAPNDEDYLTYASWGGLPIGTILCFMAGFQQGINYFNNVLLPIINQSNSITPKYKPIHQLTSQTSFAGGFAPQDGRTAAQELMTGTGTKTWSVYQEPIPTNGQQQPTWTNQNEFRVIAKDKTPNALLVVAGPQVSTAIDEINKNRTSTVIIGVDVAQEKDLSLNRDYTSPLTNSDKSKTIKRPIAFSIMKDLANITDKVLQNITNGYNKPDDPGNNTGFGGLGWNSKGDLNNAGVSISDAGKPFLYNALVKSGLINKQLIQDPTATIPEADLETYYHEAYTTVQKTPNYLYNQGVYSEVSGTDKNLVCQVPATDSKDGSNSPGLQFCNQYVSPYETNAEGKPINLKKESYVYVDDVVSKSIVKPEDKPKLDAFVKLKQSELQTDIQKANQSNNAETLKNDIKVVLSESTTVLLDNSFSQSVFEGILRYLYHNAQKSLGYLYQDFRTNVLNLPPIPTTLSSYQKSK